MARPTKYDPKFCDVAVEYMSYGYSTKALAGHIGVSLSTVYKWMEEHDEFSESVKAGQAAGAAWWEGVLRNNASTGEGNASAAIFGVKNRSQEEWRDRIEQDHTSSDRSMSPKAPRELTDAELAAIVNAKQE